MKNVCTLTLIVTAIFFFAGCENQSSQKIVSINTDSVKNKIIAIIAEMRACRGDKMNGPQKFASYCVDDAIFADYDAAYATSAKAIANDLATGTVVTPHDFDFLMHGNTAVISYLECYYELVNGDTIFHNVRSIRTFTNENGDWKLAAMTAVLQPVNYFKPVPAKNKSQYTDYTGIYTVGPGTADTVSVKDGKLYNTLTGGKPQLTYPVSDTEFMEKDDLGRITFNRAADGKEACLTYFRFDGQSYKYNKIQ